MIRNCFVIYEGGGGKGNDYCHTSNNSLDPNKTGNIYLLN